MTILDLAREETTVEIDNDDMSSAREMRVGAECVIDEDDLSEGDSESVSRL